jgi:hypothetical protein
LHPDLEKFINSGKVIQLLNWLILYQMNRHYFKENKEYDEISF